MDSSTELLSADSSTHCLSDTLVGNNTSCIEVSRKKRKTLAQRNTSRNEQEDLSGAILYTRINTSNNSRIHYGPDAAVGKQTLSLVHLTKSFKTLKITKRKSSTGRNIIQALDSRSAQALVDIKSLFGKEIRFIKLDAAKKTMTATIMKVPHPITPADVMDIVPQIKKAERMTVWYQENKCLIETRTIKIDWERKILTATINLGILGEYETNHFKRDPVRCYKFNHTARTYHAKNDICGLCGGHHRTRICVEKRNANKAITVKCHNCKGSHSTVSGRCPYRHEVFQRMRTPIFQSNLCGKPSLWLYKSRHTRSRNLRQWHSRMHHHCPRWKTFRKSCVLQGTDTVVYLVQQTNSNHHLNQSASVIYQKLQHHRRSDSPQGIGNKSERNHPTGNNSAHQWHHAKFCSKHPRLSHFPDNKHNPLNNKFQSPEPTNKIIKCLWRI